MRQSKMESLVETTTNTAIGFVIAFMLWPPIAYLVGYEYSTGTNLLITSIFTVASILRGYVIRRWFNRRIKDFSHSIATKVAKETDYDN